MCEDEDDVRPLGSGERSHEDRTTNQQPNGISHIHAITLARRQLSRSYRRMVATMYFMYCRHEYRSMLRFILLLSTANVAILVGLSPCGFGETGMSPNHGLPHWIWRRDTSGGADQPRAARDDCRLERHFDVEQAPRSAKLRLAADFCHVRVEINGHTVISVEPYSQTVDLDVTQSVRRGENQIGVSARAVDGPSAVALSLSLTSGDGRTSEILTDSQWRVVESGEEIGSAVSLGVVEPRLWGIGRRSVAIDAFDNYEQWRQAIGTPAKADQAAFWTAPGFSISLAGQAQPEEGSWVSMAFDGQGRITIAREDKGLLRMTLDATHRSVEHVETINDDLQECRGLLYAYDALYANANNSKGLYRLRDTDGDDRFDEVRLLRQFPGSVGHGRNDLALGPDGLIYSIHGDAVDVPKEDINDYTSPFREARRGKTTREGHLLRTDSDGSKWELLAAGLRNPFGIAFNPRGDLFTYDADAEFDMGSPWYRPTRVDQLVLGADFGWRGVTGKWPPYFPDHADNALPTLDIGKGSPTAVVFGAGTHFPEEYQKALFVLDWAYGRVLAAHLAPRGAGYRGFAEAFLKGRPLNVTDIAVGPDGALWILTGGRKTQSALYRIAYTSNIASAPTASPYEEACKRHADTARGLRLQLEEFHKSVGRAAIDFVWPHLDSDDPAIRYAARVAVEHQPVELWREQALREQRVTAGLSALMALARSDQRDVFPDVIDHLDRFSSFELSVSQCQTLVQIAFLCASQTSDEVLRRKSAIVSKLESLLPFPATNGLQFSPVGTSAAVQRDVARLLAELGSATIIKNVSRSLLISPVQEDRLQGLLVLRNVSSGWTKETRLTYFTVLNEASSSVGGEGMPKFLAQIREQAIATLSEQERGELADLLEPRAAGANDEPLPPSRPLVKRWVLEDFESLLRDSGSMGDASRGETVFRDALCTRCHRAGARGPAVGPDLTHVAGRFGKRDILESALSPSIVVAENYRNVQIVTTDGRQIVGRVVSDGDFRSEKLRIATEPLRPSAIVEISKRDIDQAREAETSPMPQGLLDSFTQQEVLDLLAFLTSGAAR